MEITLLIMENHGIVFLNFCGNPEWAFLLHVLQQCFVDFSVYLAVTDNQCFQMYVYLILRRQSYCLSVPEFERQVGNMRFIAELQLN